MFTKAILLNCIVGGGEVGLELGLVFFKPFDKKNKVTIMFPGGKRKLLFTFVIWLIIHSGRQ